MSASPADPTVLVVGAGPVGLLLACELTRHGVPIRVIDRLVTPTDQSRAIVVHARSLEMLERVGVVEQLIDSGVKTTGLELHADGKVIAHVPVDTVDSPFPFSVTTAQTETERILAERLTALGGTVERGVELVGFEQDDSGVVSTLRHPDGREERVGSAWIAGTDGSRSTVRKQAGSRLEGSFKGERFLLGDVEGDHDLDPRSIHTFFSAHDAPLIAFPMRGTRMRLIAQLVDDGAGDGAAAATVAATEPTLAQLQAIVDRQQAGIALRSSHWLTIFEIHHAQVPAYRIGRALLAGDAAHVHSPAGGQGMNTGMQDAFNLAWKLALVSAGRAGDALLDSYHAERHPIAAGVIDGSTKMTQLATIKSEAVRALRNRAVRVATGLTPVQHALADRAEEVDVAYRDSPVVAGSHHGRRGPRPGDAAPDVAEVALRAALLGGDARATAHTVVSIVGGGGGVLEARPPSVPGAGDGVRHVLVADGPTAAGEAGFDAVVTDPERRVAQRYGCERDGGTVVVRPDGYIGLLAGPRDGEALAGYFAQLG